ncbi:hypothetical protein VA596_29155 [Amycolatopsis sp., V23-08]|uniref:Uncharacterized protein n=1 Tax=Amycolatopsis heterodermiae TaxID=3110235 RepID=A0ABU5RBV4_9PSEU|nr:hypothetical protein [Amycolatopsis sp., V23-08]MEA5363633.1 hypothetical protein [Amycolatopsis sp., V23-08]
MLYIVLVLVLAALGLLVSALITASSLWAWVSIGLSVLAGVILVVDWLRRRRRSATPAAEPREVPEPASAEPDEKPSLFTEPEKPAEEDQTVLIPAAGELGDPADTPEPDLPAEAPEPEKAPEADAPTAASVVEKEPDEAEPGEESTSESDIALLADLDDEVVVVDEHPRYHLRVCSWVGTRDTIPIGIGEARQLGFTPCARCGPDATLVAAHR